LKCNHRHNTKLIDSLAQVPLSLQQQQQQEQKQLSALVLATADHVTRVDSSLLELKDSINASVAELVQQSLKQHRAEVAETLAQLQDTAARQERLLSLQ